MKKQGPIVHFLDVYDCSDMFLTLRTTYIPADPPAHVIHVKIYSRLDEWQSVYKSNYDDFNLFSAFSAPVVTN